MTYLNLPYVHLRYILEGGRPSQTNLFSISFQIFISENKSKNL